MRSSGKPFAGQGPRVCVIRMGWQPFIMAPLSNLVSSLAERGIRTTIVKSFARQDLGLREEFHPDADSRYFKLFFRRFTKWPVLSTKLCVRKRRKCLLVVAAIIHQPKQFCLSCIK